VIIQLLLSKHKLNRFLLWSGENQMQYFEGHSSLIYREKKSQKHNSDHGTKCTETAEANPHNATNQPWYGICRRSSLFFAHRLSPNIARFETNRLDRTDALRSPSRRKLEAVFRRSFFPNIPGKIEPKTKSQTLNKLNRNNRYQRARWQGSARVWDLPKNHYCFRSSFIS